MFCPNCGTQLPDGSKFCASCGTNLTQHSAPPVPPPAAGVPVGNVVPSQPVQPVQTPPPVQRTQPIPPIQPGQAPGYTMQPGIPPVYNDPSQMPVQKDTFYVRKMPVILIIVLTLSFIFLSSSMDDAGMTVALAVSCIPGIVLMFLIYRLDRIEPEPVPLLVKLFLGGALLATTGSVIIELIEDTVIETFVSTDSLLYCFLGAFVVAALSEELCKYLVLKLFSWKSPAFNYRFDGIVYSTTVAIGFEIIENVLYLIGNTAGTAFGRAAFPGHCVFGIYMGYYYGQAKTLELDGDVAGAKKMRTRGVLVAIGIHGFYDFICFFAQAAGSDILQIVLGLALAALMVVLNVTAYKNIKRYANDDRPV